MKKRFGVLIPFMLVLAFVAGACQVTASPPAVTSTTTPPQDNQPVILVTGDSNASNLFNAMGVEHWVSAALPRTGHSPIYLQDEELWLPTTTDLTLGLLSQLTPEEYPDAVAVMSGANDVFYADSIFDDEVSWLHYLEDVLNKMDDFEATMNSMGLPVVWLVEPAWSYLGHNPIDDIINAHIFATKQHIIDCTYPAEHSAYYPYSNTLDGVHPFRTSYWSNCTRDALLAGSPYSLAGGA